METVTRERTSSEIAELRAIISRLIELRRAAPDADTAELDRLAAAAAGDGEALAELTVERVSIVDSDGTVRVRLLNGSAAPEGAGEIATPPRAGIVFYDDEGREAGGLTYSGASGQAVHELAFRPAGSATGVRLIYRGSDGHTLAGVEIEGAPGAFFGKDGDTSLMVLRDVNGRERLRAVVAPGAAPRVEFLNDSGQVTRTLE